MNIVENHINKLQDFEISSRIDCRDVEREIASSFHFILSDNNLQNNFFNLSFQTIYRILSSDQLSLTNQQELFPKFFQRFLEIKGKQYYFLLIDLENKLEIETISKIISNEQFDIETFKSNKNSRIIMKDYQIYQIHQKNLEQEIEIKKINDRFSHNEEKFKEKIANIKNECEEEISLLKTIITNNNNKISESKKNMEDMINDNEKNNTDSLKKLENDFKKSISSNSDKLEVINKKLLKIKNENEIYEKKINNKIIQSRNIVDDLQEELQQEVGLLRKSITIPINPQSKGIFQYLKEQLCDGDDLIKNGFVNITANSKNHENELEINNIVDWTIYSEWSSKDEKNSYILFDFLDHRIAVMGLKIQTNSQRAYGEHMKKFIVRGSNSNYSYVWDEIGTWEADILNYPNQTGYFYKSSSYNINYYKYIKIEMKDQNYFGNSRIVLKHIDFFGRFSL